MQCSQLTQNFVVVEIFSSDARDAAIRRGVIEKSALFFKTARLTKELARDTKQMERRTRNIFNTKFLITQELFIHPEWMAGSRVGVFFFGSR